jgi:hypothetical protein
MLANQRITARTFQDAFIDSYSSTRDVFTQEEWRQIWLLHWNDIMLPSETERVRLPKQREMRDSVLAKTAARLGLRYIYHEMLRLDAIFSRGENWFPIEAAIEHENDCKGFESEVIKLLSVRCPLKVGITYLYSRDGQDTGSMKQIEGMIAAKSRTILDVVAEIDKTEYLFLVGVETSDKPKEISQWYSLDFPASSGPNGRTFQAVTAATAPS